VAKFVKQKKIVLKDARNKSFNETCWYDFLRGWADDFLPSQNFFSQGTKIRFFNVKNQRLWVMVLKVAINTTTPDFSYFRKSDVFLRVKGK